MSLLHLTLLQSLLLGSPFVVASIYFFLRLRKIRKREKNCCHKERLEAGIAKACEFGSDLSVPKGTKVRAAHHAS